jgi:hypothetical protein
VRGVPERFVRGDVRHALRSDVRQTFFAACRK